MKDSTTNTAALELLASALDECGWRTDAAEVREGRNPFVRSEHALAAIEKALTQQQGGEQEAVDSLADAQQRGAIGYVHRGPVGVYIEFFGGKDMKDFAEQFLFTTTPRHHADERMAIHACTCATERDRELCMDKQSCRVTFPLAGTP